MIRRRLLAAALALALASFGAWAKPPFSRGGHPAGASGVAQACDPAVPDLCAQFQDGQTFVTWTDLDTGTAGDGYRYKVYRSASPITSGNYGSATNIGDYILNNSAQLVGANPEATSDNTYTTSYRSDGTKPRIRLTDLGTQLAAFTGLFAHTAETTENAYYGVVGFPVSGGIATGGADIYIGSVGPIAESVGTWKGIRQYAYDSPTGGRNSTGQITSPTGKPIIINLHQSLGGTFGSTVANGDFWSFLMPKDASNWQEGLMRFLGVRQFTSTSYPSGYLDFRPRETHWNPLGTGVVESFWSGLGMTPLSYVGPANRRYLNTANYLERVVDWAIAHYGADANQVHHRGQSMGAMAIVTTSKMTSPTIAASWLLYPVWKMDMRGTATWPGSAGSWQTTWPFKATVAAAPDTLGTNAAAVQLPDGLAWGGTGGYVDLFSVIADLSQPFQPTYWGANQYDVSILSTPAISWGHQLDALAAFQSSRRAHGFAWTPGSHEFTPNRVFDCEEGGAPTGVCIPKTLLRLDRSYMGFSNSSIDDDIGTETFNINNVVDGDPVGCINCGFRWTITTDTAGSFVGTIDNTWMDLSPTAQPTTTLTANIGSASGGGTVTVTDGSVFISPSNNNMLLVGGTEFMTITSVAGNTVTYSSLRGRLGTTAQTHASGETITQYMAAPTGPNGGPYSTMTTDVALWNLQGGAWGAKTCVFTPNGGSPTAPQTPTILSNGVPLFTGVVINASGATAIACS